MCRVPSRPSPHPQRKSRRFYPTRLAIALASGTSGAPPEPDAHGFVLVETNYRIYAYTGRTPAPSPVPAGGDTGDPDVQVPPPATSLAHLSLVSFCSPCPFVSLILHLCFS